MKSSLGILILGVVLIFTGAILKLEGSDYSLLFLGFGVILNIVFLLLFFRQKKEIKEPEASMDRY